ncbi:MAG: ATP-binding protein [Bryobacteraceae bacterium]|nr:ATP-binding protein [Bryobacteraceae bacterium]
MIARLVVICLYILSFGPNAYADTTPRLRQHLSHSRIAYILSWYLPLGAGLAVISCLALHVVRRNQIRDRSDWILQERIRVARDLHDTVLQGFSGVGFQLEAASRLFESSPERSKLALSRAIEQSDRALLEARQTISYLRLTALDSGFVGAIQKVVTQLREDRQIQFEVQVEGEVDKMEREVESVLYLAVREAIHNAVRHASPKSIRVDLKRNSSGLHVCVKDDGIGFNAAEKAKDKWGLQGVTERSSSIGAKLEVISSLGAGTEVHITVPRR